MGLIRRSFSKHYCPACDSRLKQATPSLVEALTQQLVFSLLICFLWAVANHFNGEGFTTILACSLFAWILVNPFSFVTTSFKCKACDGTYKHNEVTCRGWGIVF